MYCKEIHSRYKKVPFGYQIVDTETFVYEIQEYVLEKTDWLSELHCVSYAVFDTFEQAMVGVNDEPV